MKRLLALGLLALLAGAACGCQTGRSFEKGCPGIYSGVKYYTDQYPHLPWDGKIFFTLDLPVTAAADTVVIPYTAFADRERPSGGYAQGCKWAEGY